MKSMEHLDEFARLERLESSVEKLLVGYKALQQEKATLESLLLQRDTEIRNLQDAVAELKDERSTVHHRVSGLLASIEEWEEGQNQAAPAPTDKVAGGGGGAVMEGPLLSMMAIEG